MASVDEIALKLGIKTGDFKAALAEANVKLKEFKTEGEHGAGGVSEKVHELTSAMRGFHHLLAAGGIIAAVREFFDFAIERAEKLEDSTDKNVIAVQEFGRAVKEGKNVVADGAVATLGFFNRIGSAFGDLINYQKAFELGGFKGLSVAREQAAVAEETSHAALENERRLAEVRKKDGAEFMAITKELASIEEKRAAQALKGVDAYDTQWKIEQKLDELYVEQANFTGTALERRKLMLEIARTGLALDEANLAVEKENEKVAERSAERRRKDEEERKRADDADRLSRSLTLREEEEIFVLQSKATGTLTAAERDRLKVLLAQREAKSIQKDIDELIELRITDGLTPAEEKRLKELEKQLQKLRDQAELQLLLAKNVDDLTDAERARLEVLTGQTVEIRAQKAAVQEVAAEVYKLNAEWDNFKVGVSGSEDVGSESDASLRGHLGRLLDQLHSIGRSGEEIGNANMNVDYGDWLTASLARKQITDIQNELNERAKIRGTISSFGEDAARSTYGDSLTDKALRDMNVSTAGAAKSLNQIQIMIQQSPLFKP